MEHGREQRSVQAGKAPALATCQNQRKIKRDGHIGTADGANLFEAITYLPERVWRKQMSTALEGHLKPEQKMWLNFVPVSTGCFPYGRGIRGVVSG